MEIEIEHRMRACIDGSYFSENSRMEHLLFSYKFHIFLLKPMMEQGNADKKASEENVVTL